MHWVEYPALDADRFHTFDKILVNKDEASDIILEYAAFHTLFCLLNQDFL